MLCQHTGMQYTITYAIYAGKKEHWPGSKLLFLSLDSLIQVCIKFIWIRLICIIAYTKSETKNPGSLQLLLIKTVRIFP